MNESVFSRLPAGDFILASASPIRTKILTDAGIAHNCFPVAIDEEPLRKAAEAESLSASEIAILLAEMKARAAAQKLESGQLDRPPYILGCDQILLSDSGIISKPSSFLAARQQLLSLNGKTHQLLSAAVLIWGDDRIWHHLAVAKITMRQFSEKFVDHYLAALGEAAFSTPASYQIEGLGAQLLERIDGCHYSILGLPLLELLAFLREHGLCPVGDLA
jgi:septum formation protein